MDSIKKRSIPLMVVCVLGLLMVPGALITRIIQCVDDSRWLFHDPSFSTFFDFFCCALPLLLIIPAAAVAFILLIADKIPKACAVIPAACALVYLGDTIVRVIYIIQYFADYTVFSKFYAPIGAIVSLITAGCFVLTLIGCIKPKLSWMALAASLAAVLLPLMDIIWYVYVIFFENFGMKGLILEFIYSIFAEKNIFFFFGIAVFLHARWKKKQAELSA